MKQISVNDLKPETLDELFDDVATLKYDLIDRVREDTHLPKPEVYMYYKGLKNRTIWLDDTLSELLSIPITQMILEWNREDEASGIPVDSRKPIKIFIYTLGGGVDEIFQLADIIDLSKTPVYTYNMGIALSAGLDVLISGHKRFALKNSKALYHSGSAGIQGTAEQIQSQTAQYAKQLDILNERVLKRTKISKELLKKKKKSEWYIIGNEQVELGIVDELITDVSELL